MNRLRRFTDCLSRMEQIRANLEDQLLVMDAQNGNGQAMDSLVARWQKRLWCHAMRLTRDQQAAWDVTQSVWCDIIRKLHTLNDPANFSGWAYKITTCKAVDWIKYQQKQRQQSRLEDSPAQTYAAAPESELQELLKKLDIDKRHVLKLYYFDELSVSQISSKLNIPAGTVKSRLHTARQELKKLWEQSC